jgi:hypothetical protein
MRNLIYLLPAILCLAALTACSDKGEDAGMNTLELESAGVSFDARGGTGSIIVKSTGGVTAVSDALWCTFTVWGSRVEVTVPAYNELSARATLLTLFSEGRKVQVPVMQSGVQIAVERFITLPPTENDLALPLHSAVQPVEVNSPALWLAAGMSGDNLILHASANSTERKRTATISLTAGPLTAQVTVTQQPAE